VRWPVVGETGAVPETVIRVVLADDHPVVLAGLRALLGSLAGFEVVGEAADGESVIRQVQLTHPHVVLMDLRMPGTDGLEATRRIRAAAPDTAVLVLTMLDDEQTVFAAMRAGAHGYLLKGAGQHELERALRGVVAGEAIFGPGVAARTPALRRRRRHETLLPPDRSRARDPGSDRDRTAQPRDRPAPPPLTQDRGEPHLLDLHQAPGDRSVGADRAGTRTGTGSTWMRPPWCSSSAWPSSPAAGGGSRSDRHANERPCSG